MSVWRVGVIANVWEHKSFKVPVKELLRRRNKVPIYATTWMNLKAVLSKEARNHKPHIIV